jgi:hypothetical protein
MNKKHIGSNFDDSLKEEKIYKRARVTVVRRLTLKVNTGEVEYQSRRLLACGRSRRDNGFDSAGREIRLLAKTSQRNLEKR